MEAWGIGYIKSQREPRGQMIRFWLFCSLWRLLARGIIQVLGVSFWQSKEPCAEESDHEKVQWKHLRSKPNYKSSNKTWVKRGALPQISPNKSFFHLTCCIVSELKSTHFQGELRCCLPAVLGRMEHECMNTRAGERRGKLSRGGECLLWTKACEEE